MQHTSYKGEESIEVSWLAWARGHVLCTLTPPPTSSLQTAIRDPPTELRSGSQYLSPSGTLRLWNICDCFRSRWFHRRGSLRRIQRLRLLSSARAWSAGASRCFALGH